MHAGARICAAIRVRTDPADANGAGRAARDGALSLAYLDLCPVDQSTDRNTASGNGESCQRGCSGRPYRCGSIARSGELRVQPAKPGGCSIEPTLPLADINSRGSARQSLARNAFLGGKAGGIAGACAYESQRNTFRSSRRIHSGVGSRARNPDRVSGIIINVRDIELCKLAGRVSDPHAYPPTTLTWPCTPGAIPALVDQRRWRCDRSGNG